MKKEFKDTRTEAEKRYENLGDSYSQSIKQVSIIKVDKKKGVGT